MASVDDPRLEGSIRVASGRKLGFAEFGAPHGPTLVWLHGTPGARRQIPAEVRTQAAEQGLRVVGIDRPGIGSSSPHVYESVAEFADDLVVVADRLGLDEFSVVGLSGGGPYALAAGARLGPRVTSVGVLGGVAPTVGPDAIGGGLVGISRYAAPLIRVARVPIGVGLTAGVKVIKPLASPALDLYARFSPPGDRALLRRPEFKAMFLDDLLNGSRKQLSAPLVDVMLFSRHWGFDLADVAAPVVWWHGDGDHIVPFDHGVHVVARLPEAELRVLEGESHLGGLGMGEDILVTMLGAQRWSADPEG